ncbi:VgrG-related protein [Kibdelosporangium persicum]|uniref:Rhs element Vgr protein n=1 Tax=Kibdelosporangium persicum TaxID=2698649 RepID=A0ABX2EZH6_9PSEU|nr:VgrG-related protein [Kibdelosporangium persicum]NRN64112.1 Rhs element Vgr protein [Kibdelosporangium persicum]
MPEQRRLDSVILTVDGSPLRTELYARLMLVHVEESVQLPDSFSLHFDDPHFELFDEDKFRPGTKIQIAFRAEGEPVVVTSGEVTAVSVEPGVTGRHELVVTGLDLTHRMARGGKSRAFTNMTDADIARRISGEYGLDPNIDGTSEVRAHMLQHNETDYAFLRRIAASIGFDFWITENKFHFKRKPSGRGQAPKLTWGENLRSFKVRFASVDACDEVVVTAWDPVDKKTITGRANTPDPGTDAPAAAQMASAAKRAFGQVTRRAGQFPAASQSEADARAQSLMAKASGGGVVMRGEAVGNPWIGAGNDVTLDKVGARLGGKYRVTMVEHIYGADRPYVTRFTCGAKEAESLVDIIGGGGTANRQEHRGWGSLVVGVVTNNDDKESQARVKIKFPTLSDDESHWARVATIGAGASRGIEWLPEVGDEVLVGFENDDKSRPIVLGGLWGRKDKPPEPNPTQDGKVKDRVMASRKNHRIVLTDDPKSRITVKLGDAECELTLEKDESTLAGETKLVISAKDIEVKAANSLKLDAAKIDITAQGAITATGRPIKLN